MKHVFIAVVPEPSQNTETPTQGTINSHCINLGLTNAMLCCTIEELASNQTHESRYVRSMCFNHPQHRRILKNAQHPSVIPIRKLKRATVSNIADATKSATHLVEGQHPISQAAVRAAASHYIGTPRTYVLRMTFVQPFTLYNRHAMRHTFWAMNSCMAPHISYRMKMLPSRRFQVHWI